MNLEMYTDPSPRKPGNNGSMEESYLSSEVPLPDGLNRLMKNSESPYDTERPLMLSKLQTIEREKGKKGANLLLKKSNHADKADREKEGPHIREKFSSDDSIENTLNEIAQNTFNPNLLKDVISEKTSINMRYP